MIVVLAGPASMEEIKKASEDYPNYIKITIDISKEIVVIGGEYHYDAEQQLRALSCKQEDIWGGGLNLQTGIISTNAMINLRVTRNNSTEILDEKKRYIFITLIKKYLHDYIKEE